MIRIPDMQSPQLYTQHIFCNSAFVELTTNEMFDVQMQYSVMGMRNAEKQCFLRKEVYQRLVLAHSFLPKGFRFRIFDAWRPFLLQQELYDFYSEQIIEEFAMQTCSEEEKAQIISQFVSEPSTDRNLPPVHTTGGAVDLTLINECGEELDMGTTFDSFSKRAYTAYYEDESRLTVRDNRRLLYQAMTKAGFTNLPSEWWHYDYGDRFWAYYVKSPAIYRGIFTKEEIHEEGQWGQCQEGPSKKD